MHNEKDEKKVDEGAAVAPADDDEALSRRHGRP
jgi:hypothetical protein